MGARVKPGHDDGKAVRPGGALRNAMLFRFRESDRGAIRPNANRFGLFRPFPRTKKLTKHRVTKAGVILAGPLRKYRPISATAVARGMYAAAQTNKAGTFIYNSDQINSH